MGFGFCRVAGITEKIINAVKNTDMKPVQCKNCKHFVRDIFYKSEGICNNDGRYTREHRVCNLLDTDEKKRDAKIKPQT